jgi:hypothetical protein
MNIAQMKLYWPGPRTADSIPTIPAMGALLSARLTWSQWPLV